MKAKNRSSSSPPAVVQARVRVSTIPFKGAWIRRHHHDIGRVTRLNITPWIRFGEENELDIISMKQPIKTFVSRIELQKVSSP